MGSFAGNKNILWLIVAISVAVVLIASCTMVLIKLKKGKKKKKEPLLLADRSVYIEALGGENNILESKVVGSRIVISLMDDSIITPEKLLQDAGVASYIKMNKKLTLVVKDNAQEVYERIFPNQ